MDILTSAYADEQPAVCSKGLAVNVHHTLYCFSSVVDSLTEGKEDLDGWILVDRWPHQA